MNSLKFSLFVVIFSLVVSGCQPSAETADKSGAEGASPKAASPEAPKPADGASATLAKCDGCGMEVPKAELTSHDGLMLCKKCMEAHQH